MTAVVLLNITYVCNALWRVWNTIQNLGIHESQCQSCIAVFSFYSKQNNKQTEVTRYTSLKMAHKLKLMSISLPRCLILKYILVSENWIKFYCSSAGRGKFTSLTSECPSHTWQARSLTWKVIGSPAKKGGILWALRAEVCAHRGTNLETLSVLFCIKLANS